MTKLNNNKKKTIEIAHFEQVHHITVTWKNMNNVNKCFSSVFIVDFEQVCPQLKLNKQKVKFSIKDIFSKCEKIRSHLLNKSVHIYQRNH